MSDVLGGFEYQVLLTMLRLGHSAYTVPIVQELEGLTDRSVAPSAVYVTLRRLEKRHLLTSTMVPPEEGEGGRARRVFTVTPEAVDLLRAVRRDVDRLRDGIEALGV